MHNGLLLSHAKTTQAIAALALCLPGLALAEIYRCEVDGRVEFSGQPCGESAVQIEVEDTRLGGRLDTGTDPWVPAPPPERRVKADEPCPYINSSEMRSLRIGRTVKVGMRPDDVRAAWGAPSSVNHYSTFTQWAYHYESGASAYVYFNPSGCVYSFGAQNLAE